MDTQDITDPGIVSSLERDVVLGIKELNKRASKSKDPGWIYFLGILRLDGDLSEKYSQNKVRKMIRRCGGYSSNLLIT